MPKKPERPSAEQLRAALTLPESESAKRWRIYEDYSRYKPHIGDLPVLQAALRHEDHFVVRIVAASIATLGPELAGDDGLMMDLRAAGTRTDGSFPPQAYVECLQALVSIGADPKAVIDFVHCHCGITNWLPLRASLESLQRVGTPEALDLLSRVVVFWWSELDKKQKQYIRTHFPGSVHDTSA